MRVVWTLEDWARAISDLPVASELPDRTVFVPNERVAHALRRALIELGVSSSLVGTRFLTLIQFAREVVLDAGEIPVINDRELGPALVHRAFSQETFAKLHREDLLELPGWDDAFARTLAELEGALVGPDALTQSADLQVGDVGRVHAALHKQGELRTTGALLQRATTLIDPGTVRGALLVVVTGFESAAEVRLLQTLPGLVWALWGVRPLRTEHMARTALLLGEEFASALRIPRPQASLSSRLQRLQMTLFGERQQAAAASDDSVRVATYAGVHEEVEAAVGWVAEQLVEHAVPAHEIAVLSPTPEPYASLLRARLGTLPWPETSLPTLSERGVPVTERSDGTRLLLVIRAVRAGLSREALAPVLQILRGSDPERKVRGRSQAWELLNAVAAVGGGPGHEAGGCAWDHAWRSAIARLERAPASGVNVEDREQTRNLALVLDLAALTPAVVALVGLLKCMLAQEPLRKIWQQLAEFAQHHLRLPPSTPPALSILESAVLQLEQHEGFEPEGAKALAWLETTLCRAATSSGRFGMPAVYLGTLAGVQGLSFKAVRIIGLVEGAVPSAAREDPVLPDAARALLSPFLLTSHQRAHRQVAAFDCAVRAARERLALSAPRVSMEGSVRQPAAVLLDVMRALFGTGHARGLEGQLEAAASEGRATERLLRERLAVSPSARLERVARGDGSLTRAETNPALVLDRMRAIRNRTTHTAQDGLLGGVLPLADVPGMSAERPISASRLATLLACPHRYLLENVLYFREAAGPLSAHTLDVMVFGTWLHAIAEDFWRTHGAQLGVRAGTLTEHRARLRTLATERYSELSQGYPFANQQAAQSQLKALCDQLDKLLKHDWTEGKPKTFVAVEQDFGYTEPCRLETEAGPLYVRGKIDKLDREGRSLLVRDIKTGASKPRRAGDPPECGIDLQLGLYALVATQLAEAWGTPSNVGVAYIFLRSGEPTRSWTGRDYPQLAAAVQDWLATARETLETGTFVRSPNRDDCKYCPYQPVCAPEVDRASSVLDDERVPRRLAQLKAGVDP